MKAQAISPPFSVTNASREPASAQPSRKMTDEDLMKEAISSDATGKKKGPGFNCLVASHARMAVVLIWLDPKIGFLPFPMSSKMLIWFEMKFAQTLELERGDINASISKVYDSDGMQINSGHYHVRELCFTINQAPARTESIIEVVQEAMEGVYSLESFYDELVTTHKDDANHYYCRQFGAEAAARQNNINKVKTTARSATFSGSVVTAAERSIRLDDVARALVGQKFFGST
jgi:hypothetical protein